MHMHMNILILAISISLLFNSVSCVPRNPDVRFRLSDTTGSVYGGGVFAGKTISWKLTERAKTSGKVAPNGTLIAPVSFLFSDSTSAATDGFKTLGDLGSIRKFAIPCGLVTDAAPLAPIEVGGYNCLNNNPTLCTGVAQSVQPTQAACFAWIQASNGIANVASVYWNSTTGGCYGTKRFPTDAAEPIKGFAYEAGSVVQAYSCVPAWMNAPTGTELGLTLNGYTGWTISFFFKPTSFGALNLFNWNSQLTLTMDANGLLTVIPFYRKIAQQHVAHTGQTFQLKLGEWQQFVMVWPASANNVATPAPEAYLIDKTGAVQKRVWVAPTGSGNFFSWWANQGFSSGPQIGLYFDGEFDEYWFWQRPLTQAEVESLPSAAVTRTCSISTQVVADSQGAQRAARCDASYLNTCQDPNSWCGWIGEAKDNCAWSGRPGCSENFIQITLPNPSVISGVTVQPIGSAANPLHRTFKFKVAYSYNLNYGWIDFPESASNPSTPKLFTGSVPNSNDRSAIITHMWEANAFTAKYVRIIPLTKYQPDLDGNGVLDSNDILPGLRVDVHACWSYGPQPARVLKWDDAQFNPIPDTGFEATGGPAWASGEHCECDEQLAVVASRDTFKLYDVHEDYIQSNATVFQGQSVYVGCQYVADATVPCPNGDKIQYRFNTATKTWTSATALSPGKYWVAFLPSHSSCEEAGCGLPWARNPVNGENAAQVNLCQVVTPHKVSTVAEARDFCATSFSTQFLGGLKTATMLTATSQPQLNWLLSKLLERLDSSNNEGSSTTSRRWLAMGMTAPDTKYGSYAACKTTDTTTTLTCKPGYVVQQVLHASFVSGANCPADLQGGLQAGTSSLPPVTAGSCTFKDATPVVNSQCAGQKNCTVTYAATLAQATVVDSGCGGSTSLLLDYVCTPVAAAPSAASPCLSAPLDTSVVLTSFKLSQATIALTTNTVNIRNSNWNKVPQAIIADLLDPSTDTYTVKLTTANTTAKLQINAPSSAVNTFPGVSISVFQNTVGLTGSRTDLNNVLQYVEYQQKNAPVGTIDTYSATVTDNGFESSPAVAAVPIEYDGTPTTYSPEPAYPPTINTPEDPTGGFLLPPWTVTDPDFGDLINVTITVGPGGVVRAGVNGTAASSINISGTVEQVNNWIASLTFIPNTDFYGNVPLTYAVAGVGSGSSVIQVNSVQDAPVVTIANVTTTEDAPVAIPAENIRVVDVDGDTVAVTVTVNNNCGTVSLNGGTPDTTVTTPFVATPASIGGFVFTPNVDFNTNMRLCWLTVQAVDSQGTPSKTPHALLYITVSPVPDAASCTTCPNVQVNEDETVPLLISLTDGDEESDPFVVTISVTPHGTLAVPPGSLCQPNAGYTTITCSGSRGAIDVELQDGVLYTTGLNAETDASYTVSWSEPSFTNTVTRTITVLPRADAPLLTGGVTSIPGTEGNQVVLPATPAFVAVDPDTNDALNVLVTFSNAGWTALGVPSGQLTVAQVNALFSSGTIRFVPPNVDYCGVSQVYIQLRDSFGLPIGSANRSTIDLVVAGAPDVAVITQEAPTFTFTYGSGPSSNCPPGPCGTQQATYFVANRNDIVAEPLGFTDVDFTTKCPENKTYTIRANVRNYSPTRGLTPVTPARLISGPYSTAGVSPTEVLEIPNQNFTQTATILGDFRFQFMWNCPNGTCRAFFWITFNITDSAGLVAQHNLRMIQYRDGDLPTEVANMLPVATGLPQTATTNEDTAVTIGPFIVEDADSTTVTILATSNQGTVSGYLTSANVGDTTQLTFTPFPDRFGPATVTVSLTDNNGGVKQYIIQITINPVNDAPILTISPQNVTIDEHLSGGITGPRVSDIDDTTTTLVLQATGVGVFTITPSAAVTATLSADGKTVTVSGDITAVNNYVSGSGVNFRPPSNPTDPVTFISVTTTDAAGLSASGTIRVTTRLVNDPSTISVTPTTQFTPEDVNHPVDGLIVFDPDSTTSLFVRVISGDAIVVPTHPMTSDGVWLVQHDLTSAPPLAVVPAPNWSGTITIEMVVAQSGTVEIPDARVTLTVIVTPVNDGPTASITPTATTTPESTSVSLTGAVADIDDPVVTVTLSLDRPEAGTATFVWNGQPVSAATGSPSALTFALAITFTPAYQFSGIAVLTLNVRDAAGLEANATSRITITYVNSAPTASGPSTLVGQEDSTVTGSYTLNDEDIPEQKVFVNITFNPTGVLSLQNPVLSGPLTVAQAQAAVANLVIVPASNWYGTAVLTLVVKDDNGATAPPVTTNIIINPVNDAPSLSTPSSYVANEDTPTTIGGITVSDVENFPLSIEISVAIGTLDAPVTPGVTRTGSPGPSSGYFLTLTGLPAALNTALAGLTYIPEPNWFGEVSGGVTIALRDNGDPTGAAPGPESHLIPANVPLTVVNTNDAPNLSVPATLTVNEDSSVAISNVVITDLDAPTDPFEITFTSNGQGILTAAPANGVTIVGSGTTTVTLRGTREDLTAALNANIVSFVPTPDAYGSTSITVTLVETSPGGLGAPTGTIAVTINPVQDAPTVSAPAFIQLDEDQTVGEAIVGVSVADVDNNAAAGFIEQLRLTATVSGGDLIFVKGDGSQSLNTVTFTGSAEFINSEVQNLQLLPTANANGDRTITWTVTEVDRTTPLSATATTAVNIVAVNDAPVVTAPASYAGQEDTPTTLSGITVSDIENNQVTLVVAISPANGRLAAPGCIVSANQATVTCVGSSTAVTTLANAIVFTPTTNQFGEVPITFTVTDNGTPNLTTSTNSKIVVAPKNDAPTLTGPVTWTCAEDSTGVAMVGYVVDDADYGPGNNGQVQLTVTSDNGRVTFNGQTGSSITVTLPIQQMNALLANPGIRYVPNPNFSGNDAVSLRIRDSYGSDGNRLAVTVVVTPVNDPPTLTVTDANGNVLGPNAVISVAEGGRITVFLKTADLDNLVLTTEARAPVKVSGNNNNIGNVGFGVAESGGRVYVGPPGNLPAGVEYAPGQFFNGQVRLTFTTTDGQATVSQDILVTVSPVADPPSITLPPGCTTLQEGGSISLSGKIVIEDADSPDDIMTLKLTVVKGTLTSSSGPLAGVTSGAQIVYTFTDSRARLNTLLNTLTFSGQQYANGGADIAINLRDGTFVIDRILCLFINPVNDPARWVCADQCHFYTLEDQAATIGTGITVQDPETDSLAFRVVLPAGSGASLGMSCAGLSDCVVTPTEIRAVGTPAQINNALQTLTFTPATDMAGDLQVTFILTDTAVTRQHDNIQLVAIVTVSAVNDPPTLSVVGTVSTQEDVPVDLRITFSDKDSTDITVTLTANQGKLRSGANTASPLVLQGTPAYLTQALNNIKYVPNEDTFGSDTVTIQVVDGHTGTSATIAVTVTEVRPTISSPGSVEAAAGSTTPVPVPITLGNVDGEDVRLTVTTTTGTLSLAPGSVSGASVTVTNGEMVIVGSASVVTDLATKVRWLPPDSRTNGQIVATIYDGQRSVTISDTTLTTVTGQCALDQNGQPCDDGDDDTVNDKCVGGVCKGLYCVPRQPNAPGAPTRTTLKKKSPESLGVTLTYSGRKVVNGWTEFRYMFVSSTNNATEWALGVTWANWADVSIIVGNGWLGDNSGWNTTQVEQKFAVQGSPPKAPPATPPTAPKAPPATPKAPPATPPPTAPPLPTTGTGPAQANFSSYTGVSGAVFGQVNKNVKFYVTVKVKGFILAGPMYYGVAVSSSFGIGLTKGPAEMCCGEDPGDDDDDGNGGGGNGGGTGPVCTPTTVQVCQDKAKTLSCPAGQKIKIANAWYGRKTGNSVCPSKSIFTTNCAKDVTPDVVNKCNGKKECTVYASNCYGNPCWGTQKYLEVTYCCTGTRTQFLCENAPASLTCPTGETMSVTRAVWGRTSSNVCRGPGQGVTMIGTSCAVDRLAQVKGVCQAKNSCQITPTVTTWGKISSACELLPKYLEVDYSCSGDGARASTEATENSKTLLRAGTWIALWLRLGLSSTPNATASDDDVFDIDLDIDGERCRPKRGRCQNSKSVGYSGIWYGVSANVNTGCVPALSVSSLSTAVWVSATKSVKATFKCGSGSGTGYVSGFLGGSKIIDFRGRSGQVPAFQLREGWNIITLLTQCSGDFGMKFDQDVYSADEIPDEDEADAGIATNTSVTVTYKSWALGPWDSTRSQSAVNFVAGFDTYGAPTAGYCVSSQLSSLTTVSNLKTCNFSGSIANIASKYTIEFWEPVGNAQWQFRIAATWNKGVVVYVDGSYIYADLAGPNTGSLLGILPTWNTDDIIYTGPRVLSKGTHVLEIWAAHSGLELLYHTIQFSRNGETYQSVSNAALQQTIVDHQGEEPSMHLGTCPSGVPVPTPQPPPPQVNVKYGVCQNTTVQVCKNDAPNNQQGCDGTALRLNCGTNQAIDIISAAYGRSRGDTTTCPGTVAASTWSWAATNGCGGTAAQQEAVMNKVKTLCQNAASCLINVAPTVFGADPCRDVPKYLAVGFRCVAITPPTIQHRLENKLKQCVLFPNATTPTNGPKRTSAVSGISLRLISYSVTTTKSIFRYVLEASTATTTYKVDYFSLGTCGCNKTTQFTTPGHTNGAVNTSSETGIYGVWWENTTFSLTAGQSEVFVLTVDGEVGLAKVPWGIRQGYGSSTQLGYTQGFVPGPCCSNNACTDDGYLWEQGVSINQATSIPDEYIKIEYSSYNISMQKDVTTYSYADVQSKVWFAQGLQPAGWCTETPTSLVNFRNRDMCKIGSVEGSSKDLAQYVAVEFREPVGASWKFRFGVSCSKGCSIFLDGNLYAALIPAPNSGAQGVAQTPSYTDTACAQTGFHWTTQSWTTGTNGLVQNNTVTLSAGRHRLEFFGLEQGCDRSQTFQFARGSAGWKDLTQDNLANVIVNFNPAPCGNDCGCAKASCDVSDQCYWDGLRCRRASALDGECGSPVPAPSNSAEQYLTYTYNSYKFIWNNAYWASSDAFWNALTNDTNLSRPAGYCSAFLTDLTNVQNQRICVGGAKDYLAYHYTMTIYEPTGADWMFRMGVDWHQGGMMKLDGEYLYHIFADPKVDLWWGGSDWGSPLIIYLPVRFIKPGLHTVEFVASETCCDGRTAVQFKRQAMGDWTYMSHTTTETVAKSCEAPAQCQQVTNMDCTSDSLSVVLAGNVTSFDAAAFKAQLVAELNLPSVAFVTIISVNQAGASARNKLRSLGAEEGVEVWFVIKGVDDQVLNEVVDKINEVIIYPEGVQAPSNLLAEVAFIKEDAGEAWEEEPPKPGHSEEVIVVVEEDTAGLKAGLIVTSILAVVLLWTVVALFVMWRRSRVVVTAQNPGIYMTSKDVESTMYDQQQDTDESSRHGN